MYVFQGKPRCRYKGMQNISMTLPFIYQVDLKCPEKALLASLSLKILRTNFSELCKPTDLNLALRASTHSF